MEIKHKDKELPNSFCFFTVGTIRIKEGESQEKRDEAFKLFYDQIEEYPENEHILIDEQENLKHLYCKKRILHIPWKIKEKVDFNLITNTIILLKEQKVINDREKFKYAGIYKVIKEGLVGTGYTDLTETGFVEMMASLNVDVGTSANLNKYALKNDIDSWEWVHYPNKHNETKTLSEVKDCARVFIRIYGELMTNNQTSDQK